MRVEAFQGNIVIKIGSLVLALILPVVGIGLFALPIDSGFSKIIYHVLWCGFYGSILCVIMFKNLYVRLLIIFPNLVLIVTIVCFSAMGGIGGSGIALLKMVIPFLPWFGLLG